MGMRQRSLTDPDPRRVGVGRGEKPPRHWHIWRVALTGRAAFMSRAYLTRAAATQAARRWSSHVADRMVAECHRDGLPASAPRRERQRSLTGSGPRRVNVR